MNGKNKENSRKIILSNIQKNLTGYLDFYKKRNNIDNILVKITMGFYNELLSFADLKNSNNSNIIINEIDKFNKNNKFKIIIENISNINKNIDQNNILQNIQFFDKNNINQIFSIDDLAYLLINVYSKIYLSTILSKKNYLSIKNINISPELEHFLKDIVPQNIRNKKNITFKQQLNNNTDIDDIIDNMKNINQFKININIYVEQLKNNVQSIQTNNYQNKSNKNNIISNKNQYVIALKNNIDKLNNDLKKTLSSFMKLLDSNKTINKKYLYTFIVTNINIISMYYKLMIFTYEWQYFVAKTI